MINKKKEPVDLDTTKVYAILFTYDWRKKGIAKFTAPNVRLWTLQLFNHGGLLTYEDGQWWLYESVEGGVHRSAAQEALLRKGSRCQIREYNGAVKPAEVIAAAASFVGRKYDTANLVLHQILYRLTADVAHEVNCLLGREVCAGLWLGKTGEAAKNRLQCFEFLFCVFRLPKAWLASGAEFARLEDFKTIAYSD